MDSKCKKCKNSAWCLVECKACGSFWFVYLSEFVGSTVNAEMLHWKVRPCEQDEEGYGHVDACNNCSGAYPEKAELPAKNGGVVIIHFRHG